MQEDTNTQKNVMENYTNAKNAYAKAQTDMDTARQAINAASKAERQAIKAATDGNPQVVAARQAINAASKVERAAQAAFSLASKLFADAANKRDNAG